MTRQYKINDIFYSLQGEGHNAGRAALFVRFSGCNLQCSFCDTDFTDYRIMTGKEIVEEMVHLLREGAPDVEFPLSGKADELPIVVLTGGEPTLQADEPLLNLIHEVGLPFIAMESNGTQLPPPNLDWLTVSPKVKPRVEQCSELKVLFDGEKPVNDYGLKADYYYLQPMDSGDAGRNQEITAACVAYIKRHPRWHLSLQTHKLINIK